MPMRRYPRRNIEERSFLVGAGREPCSCLFCFGATSEDAQEPPSALHSGITPGVFTTSLPTCPHMRVYCSALEFGG